MQLPRSRGLPDGLIDQPFYGWVEAVKDLSSPLQRGYLLEC
jgi:hypothetical protein